MSPATQASTCLSARPVHLRCESATSPVGVDNPRPRLSWQLETLCPDARGVRQGAWRVLVASSPEALARDEGDLWDSGQVDSDQSHLVVYEGRPLRSSQACWWKVCVWNQEGEALWSEPARWTMGVLSPDDWQANWIGTGVADVTQHPATVLLRREFAVKPGLKRATLHACGLGHHELSLNGQKVGEHLLGPGWTHYRKTCLYDSHDVTEQLHEGENALGLFLGNGMYNVTGGRYVKFTGSFGPPKAIAQLHLVYDDGSTQTIRTDEQWQFKAGPVTFCCVYGGEDHDARLEEPGWDKPGFAAQEWKNAVQVEGPGGELRGFSHASPPIRTHDVFAPVSVNELEPGVSVYDFGQNASMMPRLRVRGPRGSVVRMIPSELLGPDGRVDRRSCAHGAGPAWWQYTLRGGEDETWFPRFFYHGSRYLQVECTAPQEGGERPVVENLESVVVHTAAEAIGSFECSNDLFNRTWDLIRWAQRSNLVSVITDCPHREKLGWLEQYHLNGPALRYNFDLTRLFAKTFGDMADSQLDNGLVPDIAPEYVVFDGGFRDSPEWGSAIILAAWQQYLFSGDLEPFRRYWEPMKRYVAYLESRSTDGIVDHGLGDWFDLGPGDPGQAQLTPVKLTATATYYQDLSTMAHAATLLGRNDEAAAFSEKAAVVKEAFNKALFDADRGTYATGSQTSNAMPLVLGMTPAGREDEVLEAIVADVRAHDNGPTAGDVGFRYLLHALADGGRSDVIFDINNQTEKPGYGYQLARGATSLTEAWDANPAVSQNHFMLGHTMEWFYHDLAGIGPDPAGPGFRKILIRPAIVGNLTWVKASYRSPYGTIMSEWRRDGESLRLNVRLPANTTATLFAPHSPRLEQALRESGRACADAPGVTLVRQDPEVAVLALEPGAYSFVTAWPGGRS